MSLNGYPQELIERIIDFIKGNEQKVSYPPADVLVIHIGTGRPHIYASDDLRSCSLVSRAWLPRSRYHLFRHITLYGRYSPPRFRTRQLCHMFTTCSCMMQGILTTTRCAGCTRHFLDWHC
ncbi:hypothetical protein PILCRDRAFT_454554 [Piloderma croceum F 1598]|uniref:Uncharacterized protein n=1 Tax=Piloderma croceum (strain F 1598) TaxID=765440 RepID=A0A0C3B8V7_PILCF|nr:hypothetical protein PILCRDRAFT_454554 [Piloderma croceum F 1598]